MLDVGQARLSHGLERQAAMGRTFLSVPSSLASRLSSLCAHLCHCDMHTKPHGARARKASVAPSNGCLTTLSSPVAHDSLSNDCSAIQARPSSQEGEKKRAVPRGPHDCESVTGEGVADWGLSSPTVPVQSTHHYTGYTGKPMPLVWCQYVR